MRLKQIVPVAAIILLGALIQVLSALGGTWLAVIAAVGLGLLVVPIARALDLNEVPAWFLICAPGIASLMGITVAVNGAFGVTRLAWLAPLASSGAAAAFFGLARLRAKRCGLCERRIGGGMSFTCPRCGLHVCEQNCWSFDHLRCRLCLENQVPALPVDDRWWDKHTGPRATFGRCQVCMSSASEVDLRPCRRCLRPQCRRCWDEMNGQCTRCKWIMEDLPVGLKAYVAAGPEPQAETKR
jgi:hypothetical protein